MTKQNEEEKSFVDEIQEELSLGPELKSEETGAEPSEKDLHKAPDLFTTLKEKGFSGCRWIQTKACEAYGHLKAYWSSGGRKKIIIGGLGLLILLLILFGWLVSEGNQGFRFSKKQVVQPLAKALYYSLSRPLVVRFDERGVFSLIRVKLALEVRDEVMLDVLTTVDSALKEGFVTLLANGNSDKLLTREGKEELLKNFLDFANKATQRNDKGRVGRNIEAVLLQEFMMQ